MLVHGYAEHARRYDHTGMALARAGYAVHAMDLRGHGRSEGRRALVRSFDEYLDDLDIFIERAASRHAGAPLFLFGHSMGGAIVALHASERRPPVRGLLLSGAAVGMAQPRGFSLMRLVIFALARLWPGFGLRELDAAAVSRDPQVVAAYDADPLVYRGTIQAGMLAAMVRAHRRIRQEAGNLSLPMLIMHGSEDRLVPAQASVLLHERAGSSDKTLKVYDGLYHEILNEPERDTVLAEMVAWMDARIG